MLTSTKRRLLQSSGVALAALATGVSATPAYAGAALDKIK